MKKLIITLSMIFSSSLSALDVPESFIVANKDRIKTIVERAKQKFPDEYGLQEYTVRYEIQDMYKMNCLDEKLLKNSK